MAGAAASLFLVAIAMATPGTVTALDVCSIIDSSLPPWCECTDIPAGASVECTTYVPGMGDFGPVILIAPCAAPAAQVVFSIRVAGRAPLSHTITAGTGCGGGTLDIPGLSIGLPGVANAGAVLEYDVEGDSNALAVSIDVNACGCAGPLRVCASSIPAVPLPLQILDRTFNFGTCPNGPANLGT